MRIIFNRYRVSIWKHENKNLEMKGGDDCTTMLPNYTLKIRENGKFYVMYTLP